MSDQNSPPIPTDLMTIQAVAHRIRKDPYRVRWALNAKRLTRYVPEGAPNDETAANSLVSLAEAESFFREHDDRHGR